MSALDNYNAIINNSNIKNKYLNINYDSFDQFNNLIIYGPSGSGKYSIALKIINNFSNNNLNYEKKMIINFNKQDHYIKISDIHYEINLENITCTGKNLFNEIYKNICDSVQTKNNKNGIILIKNFHYINNDLLDIFYSYLQNHIFDKCNIKFVILTENLSFISDNIKNICDIFYIQRLKRSRYLNISNNNNKKIILKNKNIINDINNINVLKNINLLPTKDIKDIKDINNINLLPTKDIKDIKDTKDTKDIKDTKDTKDIKDTKDTKDNLNDEIITENDCLFKIHKSITDKIIYIILNSDINNIPYYELRNILYDLLIYNLYIPDCIYYIIEQIIYKTPNLKKYFLENIFKEITIFFKLFNNNYRPIYHLERFVLVLIYNLHE